MLAPRWHQEAAAPLWRALALPPTPPLPPYRSPQERERREPAAEPRPRAVPTHPKWYPLFYGYLLTFGYAGSRFRPWTDGMEPDATEGAETMTTPAMQYGVEIGTATDLGGGQFQFDDANAGQFSRRFYRAVQLP